MPHSVVHSRNFVPGEEGDMEHAPAAPAKDSKKDNNLKGKKKEYGPLAPFLKMRRRLTVTGTSETIDGVAKLTVDDDTDKTEHVEYHAMIRCAVSEYSGVSKKGHAPYNPRKKNQDALIMADDPSTNTLILCVLDGHGEHGDGVSTFFRDNLVNEMLRHPTWSSACK